MTSLSFESLPRRLEKCCTAHLPASFAVTSFVSPSASGLMVRGRMAILELGPSCMIVSNTRAEFSQVQFRKPSFSDGLMTWARRMSPRSSVRLSFYAVVLLRFMLGKTFCNRRVLIFVDNDAARFCLIRGLSRSSTMGSLVEAFDSLDGKDPMLYWIERVASFSNIADGPSRGASDDAMTLVGARVTESFCLHEDLSRLLLSRKRRGK